MAVVLLAAFLIIACLLALRFEKQLTAVLPLATCILILILYVLAFFRRLSWIDYFSTAIVVGAVLRVLFLSGEKKKKLFAQLRELFFAPSAIAAMVLLTGAVLLTGNKIATWWDDLNFWATDVKALYALDGFAAKYTNAASEFGDYPPGIQLLKWWFVHLKPDGFSEGLMFAGYYFGVFVFLTPLLSRLDEALQTDRRTVKQLFWTVVLVVCLAAFPSMTETFYLGGMCADLVMAVIYGVILMSCLEDRAVPGADTAAADTAAADTATADIADAASRSRVFSNLRIALYLGVLVLVKSVGFLWAAFALVFVWFWRLHGAADKKKEIRQLLCITALPAVSGGSWMLFCLLMKRVAKLTGAAVSMASGNLPILLEGTVQKRSAAVNENLKTGDIEVIATSLRILSESQTPPFAIEENSQTKEDIRLKYRYLDLRRPDIQKNLMLKSRVLGLMRQFMANEGFLEIETPILCKSTPEGARDYLVPSRVHPGNFYALPQSPQLFKQLLMASGYDRYFQIARCFRDEDLRADRQPEFTQADMELSFVDIDDVIDVNERLLKFVFKEAIGVDVQIPLQRMPWQEAMDRFGSDKPDTRFGMELVDVSETVKGCGFGVFTGALENGGSVRGINAKGQAGMPRKKIDKLVEFAKGYGAKGLAYLAVNEDGT